MAGRVFRVSHEQERSGWKNARSRWNDAIGRPVTSDLSVVSTVLYARMTIASEACWPFQLQDAVGPRTIGKAPNIALQQVLLWERGGYK